MPLSLCYSLSVSYYITWWLAVRSPPLLGYGIKKNDVTVKQKKQQLWGLPICDRTQIPSVTFPLSLTSRDTPHFSGMSYSRFINMYLIYIMWRRIYGLFESHLMPSPSLPYMKLINFTLLALPERYFLSLFSLIAVEAESYL